VFIEGLLMSNALILTNVGSASALVAGTILQIGSVPMVTPTISYQLPPNGVECELRSAAGDLLRVRVSPDSTDPNQIIVRQMAPGTWPSQEMKGFRAQGANDSNMWVVRGPDGPSQMQIIPREKWQEVYFQRIEVDAVRKVVSNTEPFAALGWCRNRLPAPTQPVASATVDPFDPARWVAHSCFFISPVTNPSSGEFSVEMTDKDPEGLTFVSSKGFPWKAAVRVKFNRDTKGDIGDGKTIVGLTFKFGEDSSKTGPFGDYFLLANPRDLIASSVLHFKAMNGDSSSAFAICGEKVERTSGNGLTFK